MRDEHERLVARSEPKASEVGKGLDVRDEHERLVPRSEPKASEVANVEGASVDRHRAGGPTRVGCVVITVSDTRTLADDSGGALLSTLLEDEGHRIVERALVKDEPATIRAALERALARADCSVVLLTGGTGVAPRDLTPEAVAPLLERTLPGFGELFRQLSFAEIGAAAMVSRALGGLAQGKLVFALPGSRAAVRLALERLILPELGHLVGEATKAPA